MKNLLLLSGVVALFGACQPGQDRDSAEVEDVMQVIGTFGYDLEFLQNNLDDVIVLSDANQQAQVIIAPEYQGRVMTSTARGEEGRSFGWINHDLIASGEVREHINPYGGEDRFWLGPEGGQYAIFFQEGDEFVFDDWQTPAPLDTEPFEVVRVADDEAVFSKKMKLQNFSGFQFDLEVNRTVRLMDQITLEEALGATLDTADVDMVGFTSENRITNIGEASWEEETGLLSIWILGMFIHSPSTTVVIPYKETSSENAIVNDSYFGKVPQDRLKVEDGYIFFKADGDYRSKIGVPPENALPVMGSYDPENQVLTIVKFSLPEGKRPYVNSMWELQDQPYAGDAVNSYNDGPLDGSEPLGPFYELESSSPAAALEVGASITHQHTTVHFMGSEANLNSLAQEILGTDLQRIQQALAE